MGNFSSVEELRDDALWVAGEAPDSSSDYFDKSVDYLNAVLQTLISGGPLGGAVVDAVDWLWARANPRGTLVIEPKYESTVTGTFTKDSPTVTLSAAPGLDLTGYRITVEGAKQHPLVITHAGAGTTIILNAVWVGDTVTTNFTAAKGEITLPADFQRFASPL